MNPDYAKVPIEKLEQWEQVIRLHAHLTKRCNVIANNEAVNYTVKMLLEVASDINYEVLHAF